MSKPADIPQYAWDIALCWVERANYSPEEALVVAARAVMDGQATERELCAKTAEECWVEGSHWRRDIAASIRARSALSNSERKDG